MSSVDDPWSDFFTRASIGLCRGGPAYSDTEGRQGLGLVHRKSLGRTFFFLLRHIRLCDFILVLCYTNNFTPNKSKVGICHAIESGFWSRSHERMVVTEAKKMHGLAP